VVGTDHAGIATQIVVERQLEAEGKSRHDLARGLHQARVGMEAAIRFDHHAPDAAPRASANWSFADTEGQKAGYFTMDARCRAR